MADDNPEIETALAGAGIGVPPSGVEILEALPSLTNRVWRVRAGGQDLVVRLPGAGTERHIDRLAEAHNLRVAADLGAGAPVRFVDELSGVLIMPFQRDGSVPDLVQMKRADVIGRVGGTLRRLHEGPDFLGVMDPFDKIDRYLSAAGNANPDGDGAFADLWAGVVALRRAVAFQTRSLRPCHVDPVPENMLITPGGLTLIDWEYAAMSEPLWDLAYVAVEAAYDERERDQLLKAYGRDKGSDVELDMWCAVTMAVTVAWCLMQQVIGEDTATCRAYKKRRLGDLRRAFDSPRLRHHVGWTGD